MERKDVGFTEALRYAEEGWLILYRGKGLISSWIKLVTGGVHSHAAMVVKNDRGELEIAEVRECVGGRFSKFYEQYHLYKGTMDFYEPQTQNYPELDLKDVSYAMRFIVGNADYSYWNLLKILVRKIPFLWRFFDRGVYDEVIDVGEKYWHCSDSVSAAYQYGGVDPVPNMPNDLVAPNDLTHSLLFKYRFSL